MVKDVIRVIDKRRIDLIMRRFCTKDGGDHLKDPHRHYAENSFPRVQNILDDIGKGIEYSRARFESILHDPPKKI